MCICQKKEKKNKHIGILSNNQELDACYKLYNTRY